MKYIFTLIIIQFSLIGHTAPVKGYADLHVHMFANNGFAGGWFTGNPAVSKKNELFNYCPESKSWPRWTSP